MDLSTLINKIRTRENSFYSFLHDAYKSLINWNFPAPSFIGGFFYTERKFRKTLLGWFKNKFYWEPMLRYRCSVVGARVTTSGDIPLIVGNGRIIIGDRVKLGNCLAMFVLQRFQDLPELTIGDDSTINYCTVISVCSRVTIGKRCKIAGEVKIFDNNSHSIFPENDRIMTENDIKPIVIEDDVWVGMNSIILKGVTLGKGCVVAAGAVVTKDVPPMTVVGGNPARILKKIEAS